MKYKVNRVEVNASSPEEAVVCYFNTIIQKVNNSSLIQFEPVVEVFDESGSLVWFVDDPQILEWLFRKHNLNIEIKTFIVLK